MQELERFSPALAERERWLVLNKQDLLDDETFAQRRESVCEALQWKGPVYAISAVSGEGTQTLCGDLMTYLETCKEAERENPELAEAERERQREMQAQARERIEELRRGKRAEATGEDDDFDDGDGCDYNCQVAVINGCGEGYVCGDEHCEPAIVGKGDLGHFIMAEGGASRGELSVREAVQEGGCLEGDG